MHLLRINKNMKERQPMEYSFQTAHMMLSVNDCGQASAFIDKATGENVLKPGPFAWLTEKDGTQYPPRRAEVSENQSEGRLLTLTFADHAETTVTLAVEAWESYLVFRLMDASRRDFHSVRFVSLHVDIDYDMSVDTGFTACLMGMTLATRMAEHPGQNTELIAEAFTHIGLSGNTRSPYPPCAAVIGVPHSLLRAVQRTVLDAIPSGELPKSFKGGPYADRALETAQRSYTIMTSHITPANVDEVIETLRKFGIRQVNLHHMGNYCQGDFRVYPEVYPGGLPELREVVDRLHAAGFDVGMQTYTFFLDPRSTFLSPVPHPDLDVLRRFTLSRAMLETDTVLYTRERLDDVTTYTGYTFVNSLYLWVDDELMMFGGVDANGHFTEVERGALGTKAATHAADAEVRQLKAYFYYFSVKPGSTLFYEVARRTAELYNALDLDLFYLDAIDGTFILDGEDYVWYHAMDFVREMFKHLKSDPVFDCCYNPQYTGTWYVRSLYGALVRARTVYEKQIDAHVQYNNTTARRMGVTPELGWFDLYPAAPQADFYWQTMPVHEEHIAYLYGKLMATDATPAFLESLWIRRDLPVMEKYAALLRHYEDWRSEHKLSAAARRYLSGDRAQSWLDGEDLRKASFTRYRFEHLGDTCQVANAFSPQRPMLRIENLFTAADYDTPEGIVLADFDEREPAGERRIVFPKPVDARGLRGIGVWAKGDNGGGLLCLRLRNLTASSRRHGDHFIRNDFTGWRYFALCENQNAEPLDWPRVDINYRIYEDLQEFYGHYASFLDYATVEALDVLYRGGGTMYLKAVKLLPQRAPELVRPTLAIGDQQVIFDTSLAAGRMLTFSPEGEAQVIDTQGIVYDHPRIIGTVPQIDQGISAMTLTAEGHLPCRTLVTLGLLGESLSEA